MNLHAQVCRVFDIQSIRNPTLRRVSAVEIESCQRTVRIQPRWTRSSDATPEAAPSKRCHYSPTNHTGPNRIQIE